MGTALRLPAYGYLTLALAVAGRVEAPAENRKVQQEITALSSNPQLVLPLR